MIALNGSVAASLARMITASGAPSAISTKANGSLRRMAKVLSSFASIASTKLARVWPNVLRTIQRLMEGITSLVVTGWSSWNLSPLRKVKV